jgi:2-keto-4-pentenoate hydratase/2-oxohepta-3-ene-1,7-dioic acid hydratase in catechol pathway
MRLIRFESGSRTGVGALTGDEGSERVLATPWPVFEDLFALPDPLAAVRDLDLSAAPEVSVSRHLAPVVDRPQVIGVGGNYAEHTAESGAGTREPVFFPFLPGAVIGPDDDIVIPAPDTQTDYEVEFAVVIGRTAKRLREDNAMDHVFGYTIVNDVSAREVMIRERMQMMLSKSPDTFVPVGPCVVTRDDIPDPYGVEIASYLNGEVRQRAKTAEMAVRIPALLSMLTRTITLRPGDIVTTGTPSGVGFFRDPPEFMAPGDVITVTAAGVGRMSNRVTSGW